MPLPSLILVLGGAASGKSAHAESICFQWDGPRIYLATAQAFDDEMRSKINDHRAQRGEDWTTIEAPLDLISPLAARTSTEIVLLDCATLWLSNHLLAESDLPQAEADLLSALAACPAPVVVVSNEVGHGIVPEHALSRRFRNAQGRLNQKLAAQADRVVQVTAGLPHILKDSV